jgi:hypothetical protein
VPLLENPFWTREVRQHAHRPLPVQVSLLANVAALSFFFLGGLLLRASSSALLPFSASDLVNWLLFCHTLCCLTAGAYAADRVFGEEQRRATLEGTLLLPYPPWQWLFLKLAHPSYLVLLAWAVALPVYLMMAVARLAPFPTLLSLSRIPLLAGFLVVAVVLLLPPDYLRQLRAIRMTGARAAGGDPDAAMRGLLLAALLIAVQYGLITGAFTHLLRGQAFYSIRVPGWLVWGLMGGAFLAASLSTAMAVVLGDERSARRAFRLRGVALALLYYGTAGLLLGPGWRMLPEWVAPVALVLLPAAVVGAHFLPKRRREDRRAEVEVGWMAGRWDSPVLLKDLRVYTRFRSLQRSLLAEMAVLAVLVGLLAYLMIWLGGNPPSRLVDAVTRMAGVFAPFILTAEWSIRPFFLWTKERTGNTLALLFLTPLRSEEILRSRLFGGLLYSCAAHAPLLVLAIAALVLAVVRGAWIGVLALLAGSPVLFLFAVGFGCTVRPQSGPLWKWTIEDWLEVPLAILQLPALFGCVALGALGRRLPFGLALSLALFLFAVNAAITWACYHLRVRQFDALRRGDLELPPT